MDRKAETDAIEKVLAGDTEAFSALVELYSAPVFGLIARICGSREDAEELTQDTFLKAYAGLRKFRMDSSFSTWLYRIAYNTAVSHARKKRYENPTDDFTGLASGDRFSQHEASADEREGRLVLMERAMSLMEPRERAVLLLYYRDGMSLSDIAAVASTTAGNAKTRLHRIRKRLGFIFEELDRNG